MVSVEQVMTFKRSADQVFDLKDYTSATILYFKTWFAIHDVILLKKIGYAPKDHTERFRLLQEQFPKQYDLLDAEFATYRSTYTRITSVQNCLRIRTIVQEAIDGLIG